MSAQSNASAGDGQNLAYSTPEPTLFIFFRGVRFARPFNVSCRLYLWRARQVAPLRPLR